MLNIELALQKGISAHNKGQLKEAERLYLNVLELDPENPDANHYLGALAVADNDLKSALKLFRAALEAIPDNEQYWLSYIDILISLRRFAAAGSAVLEAKGAGITSESLLLLGSRINGLEQTDAGDAESPSSRQLDELMLYYQNGRYLEAQSIATSLSELYPKHQFSWKILGALYGQSAKKEAALIANKIALDIVPNDSEACNNLAVSMLVLGKFHDAELNLRRAIELRPSYVEAHANLGFTFLELGKYEESVRASRLAISLRLDYFEAHSNLGVALQGLMRLEEAESSLEKAILLKNDSAEAHFNLANILKQKNQLSSAEVNYRKAVLLNPLYVEAHHNLGVMLQELGKLKEAEVSFEQAIAVKPTYSEAHRYLALIKKYSIGDAHFQQMEKLLSDNTSSIEQRCQLNFALAHASEKLGEFEGAFHYFEEGNAIRKALLDYDIRVDIKYFDELKDSYALIKEHSLSLTDGSKGLMPVFIIGMPRSGTTLVEQIISSHSGVFGAGELDFVDSFGAAIALGKIESNEITLLSFRKRYLKKLQELASGCSIVTDKMPHNFRYIGMLAAAFPEAKFIHVQRNPAAVCWGNYKQYFVTESLGYSYGLDDIVEYYGLYERLMEFWHKHLEHRIYRLNYDTLTMKQESESRKLIRYLELDWESGCMEPHANKRNITTASNLQIREQIYQGSSEHWKIYKPYLNGILDKFDVPMRK